MMNPETTMEMVTTIVREYNGTSPEARRVLMEIAEGRQANGLAVPWETGNEERDAQTFAHACAIVDWAISAAFGEWSFLAEGP